jgi:hypothetical protein
MIRITITLSIDGYVIASHYTNLPSSRGRFPPSRAHSPCTRNTHESIDLVATRLSKRVLLRALQTVSHNENAAPHSEVISGRRFFSQSLLYAERLRNPTNVVHVIIYWCAPNRQRRATIVNPKEVISMNTKKQTLMNYEITSIFFLGQFHDNTYPLRKQH